MAVGEIYVKLVVDFADDPKVRALARYGADAGLARDLYVQMVCYCKRMLTDGFVPAEQVGLLVYPLPPEHGNQLAKQLASVGLINEVSKPEAGGWQVCAYLARNSSKEDVEQLSKVRAEAGRQGGRKSRKRPAQRPSKATGKQVGNQDASKDPPHSQSQRHKYSDTYGVGRGQAAPDEPSGDSGNVGDVVAAYVDGATGAGQPSPAASLRARVGKDARRLLGEGFDLQTLIAAARTMGAGEWNELAVQVRKDAASTSSRASPNGHRPPRGGAAADLSGEVYGKGKTRI